MNLLHRIELWGDSHHPRYMDIVRIALGIFLIYKGVDFLINMASLGDLIAKTMSFGGFAVMMIGHYIAFAHIVGGILLTLGLLTRFACVIQIPILLGAIILLNFSGEVFRPYAEVVLSVIVLLLLVYFLIAGNGSFAYKMEEEPKRQH